MTSLLYSQRVAEVVILIVTGALLNSPIQIFGIYLGLLLTIIFLLLFVYFILFENTQNSRYHHISKGYLLLLLLLPLFAAAQANRIFGQSISDGLIANSRYFMFCNVIYIFYYFKYKCSSTKHLETSILLIGWVSAILLGLLNLFYSDNDFIISSFDGSVEYVYSVINISSPCIVWSGFIYLAKYKVNNKNMYFILFLLFVSHPIVFCNARSYSIALIVCFVVFYFREFKISTKANIALLFFIVVILFIGMLGISSYFGKFVSNKIYLYENAIAALTGSNAEEFSANARLLETNVALDFIKDNYFLGSGVLKASTQKEYIKEYFYPTDVGILGILFNYGLFGLTIFLYQVKIFRRIFMETKTINNAFIIGTTYYLLLQYMSSIFNGSIVYEIGLNYLLLGILVYGREGVEENGEIQKA